jgi:hypothetical protein
MLRLLILKMYAARKWFSKITFGPF